MRERFEAVQSQRPVDRRTARALGLDRLEMPYKPESTLWPGHGAVRVDDFWLTMDLGDGWRAAFRLMPHRGQAVVGELRVFPDDEFPGQDPAQWSAEYLGVRAWARVRAPLRTGITARLLRRVPLGGHLKYARELITKLGRSKYTWQDLGDRGLFSERAEKRERADRRPDVFYARIAQQYADLLAAGSRRPVADLAERRRLASSVVRDAVRGARERGFLTMGTPGKPGGVLTSKTAKVLRARKGK